MFKLNLSNINYRLRNVTIRMASNFLSLTSQNSIFTNLCKATPLSSALQKQLGGVRTKSRKRFRPVKYKYKLNENPVDKRLPINYVYRVMPTALTHPGDHNKNLGFIDPMKPKLFFENSEELQTADEDVKRLFSLAMAKKSEILDTKFEEMRQRIQRHRVDNSSHEVDIGSLTITIRDNFQIYLTDPSNKSVKRYLHSAICCRDKLLNQLYRIDQQRYEWLLNVLELDHEKPKLGMTIDKPTRKTEMHRLTEEYCDKIRFEKTEAYRQQLKSKQAAFLEEKSKALELITKEEKAIEDKMKQLKIDEELWWHNKSIKKQ